MIYYFNYILHSKPLHIDRMTNISSVELEQFQAALTIRACQMFLGEEMSLLPPCVTLL